MTEFQNPWWDSRYKIRSNILLSANSKLPGSESLCSVRLNRQSSYAKIKSDYSDLYVVRYSVANGFQIIPFYVVEEDEENFSVVFKQINPITQAENYEYCLYYCAKSESRLNDAVDILDQNDLTMLDYGQLDDNTRWTFQKPSLFWIENKSSEPGAKAVFEFVGHKADFFFKVGPSGGKFEYKINSGPKTTVDSYSETESESKLLSIDTEKIGVNKIRFTILGQSNPASFSTMVNFIKVEFNQTLPGEILEEEFFAQSSNTFLASS
jgi:hypothetical protein